MMEYINLLALPFVAIDLTHTIKPIIPTWDGSCGFSMVKKVDYDQCSGVDKFRVQQFSMAAGIGTHMDAPAHCIEGSPTIDMLNLGQLIVPCVVIDVSAQADAQFSLNTANIMAFEQQYGPIKSGSFVIIYTGWDQYWNDPARYRNNLVFPSISPEAANLLLQRNILGIGIDTLSPDRPDNGFPVHRIILGAGKYIVENIAHAKQLPATGSTVVILPIKVDGATECPVRMVGLIPKDLAQ